jgi:uncharacterized protein
MQIELNNLEINDKFEYNQKIEFDKGIYHNKEIKDIKKAYLKGYIYYNSAEILEINLNVEGIMILRDSVTLEPIDYPFNIKINEEYSLNEEYFKEYYEKEQNILDIMAILWENIVLEVPMHLTNTKDAKLSGDGWSLGSNKNDEEIDPRLAKLTELLDERKE